MQSDTKFATGESKAKDSYQAGIESAKEALHHLGRKPNACIVFATAGYNQKQLILGIKEIMGDCHLSGCSAEGIISQSGSDEGARAVVVMAMASSKLEFFSYRVENLKEDSVAAAKKLASDVTRDLADEKGTLLLFTDSLSINATQFLKTLDAGTPERLNILGGNAADNYQFKETLQYYQNTAVNNSASALLIRGPLDAEIVQSHGCQAVANPMTVTHAESNILHQIDGRPAWDVFKDYLGEDVDDLTSGDIVHLCIGVEQYGERAKNEKYLIRTPHSLIKETGSLVFAVELPVGEKIQIVRRIPENVGKEVIELGKKIKRDKKPLAVLQFDCCGRGRILLANSTDATTIFPLQNAIGKDVPWIGFHTYGEIGPLADITELHTYTVVLCALYEE